jgi:hypothetical protein
MGKIEDSIIISLTDALTRALKERDKAHEKISELQGILDLTKDEYVAQVGVWKIIQRLEEERDELKNYIAQMETQDGKVQD